MPSLPPAASRGPGRVLSLEAKRTVERVRGAQASVSEPALKKKRDREANPKKYERYADRTFATFRDSHGVLRTKLGRFAKETTPKHKRPKRIPWEKKEK